ncbi:unnamed protein product [Malus baccata var. baccata]
MKAGVSKVSIEGANKDLVEVIGDDVDSVCLTRSLRKKLGCSCTIVKVEEVKPAVKTEENFVQCTVNWFMNIQNQPLAP